MYNKNVLLNSDEKIVLKLFWEHIKSNKRLLRQKNKMDLLGRHTSDIRSEFITYIENMRSEKLISDDFANTITL